MPADPQPPAERPSAAPAADVDEPATAQVRPVPVEPDPATRTAGTRAQPTSRRAITRAGTFVRKRSRTQRVGGLAAALLIVTAPFGGMRAVEPQAPTALELGKPVDIGPFEVTVRNVLSVADLAPAVSPDPGDRLLVFDVEATNTSDRAEYADLITKAFSGAGTGAVAWLGTDAPALRMFTVEDSDELPASEFVNPGMTYRLALVLQQDGSWSADTVHLRIDTYGWRADDPLTLDPDVWVLRDEPAAEGDVPVEMR